MEEPIEPEEGTPQSSWTLAIAMLRNVLDGDTYDAVASRHDITRTAVERRIKAVAIHVANNMIGMAFVPFQDLGTVMDRSAGVGSPVVLLQFAAAAVAVAIIVWLSGRWGVARTGPRVILGAAR